MLILGKFFKRIIQNIHGKESSKFLDKIIGCFQTIMRGIVLLNESKRSKEPSYEELIPEIDTDKVQALVEMGFSQVKNLLIFSLF